MCDKGSLDGILLTGICDFVVFCVVVHAPVSSRLSQLWMLNYMICGHYRVLIGRSQQTWT